MADIKVINKEFLNDIDSIKREVDKLHEYITLRTSPESVEHFMIDRKILDCIFNIKGILFGFIDVDIIVDKQDDS